MSSTAIEDLFQNVNYIRSPKLCALCQTLTFKALQDGKEIEHQPGFKALEHSASNGCTLCDFFYKLFFKADWYPAPEDWEQRSLAQQIEYMKGGDGIGPFRVSIISPGNLPWLRYERLHGRENRDPEQTCSQIWLSSLTSGNSTVPRRPHLPFQSFDLCKYWISRCCHEHGQCGELYDKPLPTRLLDIGLSSASPIKLVETGGQLGRYVTLSHCWGGFQPLKTMTTNYHSHLQEIPWDDLPKTFQDALVITRALGFGYIWIDSLCITQNSRSDWEVECFKMDDTFQNSAITIAAPNIWNPNMGMLIERTSPNLCCPLPISAGRSEEVVVGPIDAKADFANYTKRNTPLGSRAWVLQERLLSPRILFFGKDEMYYECRRCTWYETRWEDCTHSDYNFLDYVDKEIFHHRSWDDESWAQLVQNYSCCKLTHLTDKLPALAGIAQRFADSRKGDTYLAGLWRRDLVKWMLWASSKAAEWPTSSSTLIPGAMPSWSWAKLNDAVFYREFSIEISEVSPQVDIERAEVVPTGLDPFGELLSGVVVLKGYLKTLRVVMEGDTLLFSDDRNGHIISGNWMPDVDQRSIFERICEQGGVDVCCLLMRAGHGIWGYPERKFADVLTIEIAIDQVDRPNVYRRTGMGDVLAHLQHPQDYDRLYEEWTQGDKSQITLV